MLKWRVGFLAVSALFALSAGVWMSRYWPGDRVIVVADSDMPSAGVPVENTPLHGGEDGKPPRDWASAAHGTPATVVSDGQLSWSSKRAVRVQFEPSGLTGDVRASNLSPE